MDGMRKILQQHHISFQHAFAGLWWAVSTQPNFRIHLIVSTLVLLLCWHLEASSMEWTVIVFTILLGLTAEMINTSLEAMTDLITKEWRTEAKIAKDVAAGMMLTVATGAVIVGLLVLGPKLWIRLGY